MLVVIHSSPTMPNTTTSLPHSSSPLTSPLILASTSMLHIILLPPRRSRIQHLLQIAHLSPLTDLSVPSSPSLPKLQSHGFL